MRTNTTPLHLSSRFVLLFFCLLLAGCIDTDHLLLTQAPPPRVTPKAPVKILDTTPTRPFVKLAMVEAKEKGQGYATWEELRTEVIRQAEQLNADAVMEFTTSSENSGAMLGTSGMLMGSMGSIKQLRAIAIRYTTP